MATFAQDNLTLIIGTTFYQPFQCFIDIAQTMPFDLTDWTATLTILTQKEGTLVQVCTVGNGMVVMGGTSGNIGVTIPASITATYGARCGVYELTITNGTSVLPLESAIMNIEAGI